MPARGKPQAFAVLNARFHEQEAYIVAEAGVPGAVTIATNMAGRGTDIQLGGNRRHAASQRASIADDAEGRERDDADERARSAAEIAEPQGRRRMAAGGLYVIGTERHESRRIDNQLRGRSGRQGDPGRSKFFLSLRRRSDAHLRLRAAWTRMLTAPRPEGGRGDHPSLDQQGAGEGAAEGRGAQLRHPQEPAEIRRRHERPAQGDLRAARRVHEGRRASPRPSPTCATTSSTTSSPSTCPNNAYAEQWDVAGLQGRAEARARPRPAGRRLGQGRRHRRRGIARRASSKARRRAHGGQGRRNGAPT